MNEMDYVAFKRNFRDKIESGLTREQFLDSYACTTDDMEMFDKLKATVEQEEINGEAFIKGFTEK